MAASAAMTSPSCARIQRADQGRDYSWRLPATERRQRLGGQRQVVHVLGDHRLKDQQRRVLDHPIAREMSKLGAFPDQALERLVLRHEFQPVQFAWLVPKASVGD